ncbi:hypothetical protein FALBO_8510, partial [Fusarium albosuccineum]
LITPSLWSILIMDGDYIVELLEACAWKISEMMQERPTCHHALPRTMGKAEGKPCGTCSKIQTDLGLISIYLESEPGAAYDPNIQQHAVNLLDILQTMCSNACAILANYKRLVKEHKDLVLFDVLAASMVGDWQDLCIKCGGRVSLALHDNGLFRLANGVEAIKHDAVPGEGVSLAYVLEQYQLNIRQRLGLAHALALAFWQYYLSPLMHRSWSSRRIWFMPERDLLDASKRLPLKACVSFHPEVDNCEYDASEFVPEEPLINRCPRILSLVILLLEIGLGRPFPQQNFDTPVQQLNYRYSMAAKFLKMLESAQWESMPYKQIFTDAIAKCFECNLMGKGTSSDGSNSPIGRREALYEGVVVPLEWLKKRHLVKDRDILYLTAKSHPSEIIPATDRQLNGDIPSTRTRNTVSSSPSGTETVNDVQSEKSRGPIHERDFEIAIICALTLEADAIEALFDRPRGSSEPCYKKPFEDSNTYSTGSFGRHNVVLIWMPDMGKSNAASVASNCRRTFPNIKLAIVVGVCGIAPLVGGDEIILGDVIISDGIIQYDLGRQFLDRFARKDTLLDANSRPNTEIRGFLKRLRGIEGGKTLRKRMLDYLKILQQEPKLKACYPEQEGDILFESSYEHVNEKLSCEEAGCSRQRIRRRVDGTPEPAVHFGLFASGDTVMKSARHRDEISQRDDVAGFEMEGAGVWEIFPCVVIKGGCDYADSHKTKAFQSYAAATAASCARAFLHEWDS